MLNRMVPGEAWHASQVVIFMHYKTISHYLNIVQLSHLIYSSHVKTRCAASPHTAGFLHQTRD